MATSSSLCIINESESAQRVDTMLALANRLEISFCPANDTEHRYHLVYTDNRLKLQYNPHQHKYKHRSVSVEFLHNNEVITRIRKATIKEPLARAVGIKSGVRPSVADTTAGLGLDGLTLAWLGCKVTLIERSAVIFALLDDGLKRAAEHPLLHNVIRDNISLRQGDARHVLPELRPDTILIDPMYPQMKKSPRNKMVMRVLREIVGDDTDAQELFTASSESCARRTVVKRPKGAADIVLSPSPSHRIAMKSGRFDIYLSNHL